MTFIKNQSIRVVETYKGEHDGYTDGAIGVFVRDLEPTETGYSQGFRHVVRLFDRHDNVLEAFEWFVCKIEAVTLYVRD